MCFPMATPYMCITIACSVIPLLFPHTGPFPSLSTHSAFSLHDIYYPPLPTSLKLSSSLSPSLTVSVKHNSDHRPDRYKNGKKCIS